MKSFVLPLSLLPLAAGVALTAVAQDKVLTREQLPAAVRAAADKETQGATIKGYATETEHGKKVYEVETVGRGHTRDLQFAADGTLNEIEEEVPLASLPADVSRSLTTRAKDWKILKVESLTKSGKLVAYEASIEKNGHKGEIQVGPNGGKLSHEE